MQTMNTNPTLFLPSQQSLDELRFLLKLGCQKPWWDQARLSSLVNKQVAPQLGRVIEEQEQQWPEEGRRLYHAITR